MRNALHKNNDISPGSILILDDEPEPYRRMLAETLREEGYIVRETSNIEEARSAVQSETFDIALVDFLLDGESRGTDFLQVPETRNIPVVMISAYANRSEVAEAMRQGAFDFLDKGESSERLLSVIRNAVRYSRALHKPSDRFPMIGSSPAMRQLRDSIRRWARSKANVLIYGEPGTGKEAVANLLHQFSPRCEKPFVPVNCAGISDELSQSELFGHVKGAYSGALYDRKGAFEAANEGTLYLAEIGGLSKTVQAKLLHPLSLSEIQRLGSDEWRSVDVRVVAATNEKPEEVLRPDFLGRFDTVIAVPALRERRQDIPEIVDYWMQRLCAEEQRYREISPGAVVYLMRMDLPDNVRDIIRILRNLIVMGEYGTAIQREEIEEFLESGATFQADPFDPTLSYREARLCFERELISQRLKMYAGSTTKTAQSLGLSRTSLFEKRRACGLL